MSASGTYNHILRANDGNVSQTARDLGLRRQSLQRMLRRYRLEAERSGARQ